MAQLIVNGTFERFPELRFYFAEINAAIFPAVALLHGPRLPRVQQLVPARAPEDAVGVHEGRTRSTAWCASRSRCGSAQELPDDMPLELFWWGSDFPHSVGTFPHSRKYIEETFAGLDDRAAPHAPRRERGRAPPPRPRRRHHRDPGPGVATMWTRRAGWRAPACVLSVAVAAVVCAGAAPYADVARCGAGRRRVLHAAEPALRHAPGRRRIRAASRSPRHRGRRRGGSCTGRKTVAVDSVAVSGRASSVGLHMTPACPARRGR